MRVSLFNTVEKIKMKSSEIRDHPECLKCRLDKQCGGPVHAYGDFKKKILVIGEAPGQEEDAQQIPFIGKSGQILRKIFDGLGYNLFSDCTVLNSIQCRPPNNREPTMKELNYCQPYVQQIIRDRSPKLILCFGGVSLKSLLQSRWHSASADEWKINRWRGFCIPDQELNCWIAPIFHPAFLLRNEDLPNGKIIKKFIIDDIRKAIKKINSEFPKYKVNVFILNEKQAIKALKKLLEYPNEFLLTFDYETNSLKPWGERKRLVSCAFSVDSKTAYSFEMSESIAKYWKRVLAKKTIFKTAHNMKFERMWSKVFFGQVPDPLCFDSILAAHVLDNRSHITGAKFQTYVNFGIPDYSSSISKYLTAEHGNALNEIHKIPLNELLLYNGYDAVYEFGFTIIQMKKLKLKNLYQLENREVAESLWKLGFQK